MTRRRYGGPFCQDTGEGQFKVETSPFFLPPAGGAVWGVGGVSGRNRGDVDLGRCLVAERLVGAAVVVEVEVAG